MKEKKERRSWNKDDNKNAQEPFAEKEKEERDFLPLNMDMQWDEIWRWDEASTNLWNLLSEKNKGKFWAQKKRSKRI